MTDTIDYPHLIDSAMRSVVRDVLKQVKIYGLPGDHHFFVSFRTDHPATKVSEALRSRYPNEMTVVIQHQFWDLKIEESYFSVMLSFNNVPEKLVIPFEALTAFADPSVKFGLQFHATMKEEEGNEAQENLPFPAALAKTEHTQVIFPEVRENADNKSAEVISLDAFRKK